MKKLLLLFASAALTYVAGAQTLSMYGNNAMTRALDRTGMCLYNAMPSAGCLVGGGSLSAATSASSSASLPGVPLVKFQSHINVGAVFQDGAGGPIADVGFGARVGRFFMPVSKPDSVVSSTYPRFWILDMSSSRRMYP